MPTLGSDSRKTLERVVIEARDIAEAGSRAALEALAVHEPKYYPHMSQAEREMRNHLRARARQLGDHQDTAGRLSIDHLAGECAYEHWHRMLFARFLAESGLLIEPDDDMAISLAEAEELAKEDGASGGNVWVYASRCAQRMLPQLFRPDDPLLQITFATEHRIKLERLLASLAEDIFRGSDALGWVYQFWQSKKKDEVNRSEVKIGADEISAVTQLFTEPYMVDFLYHNTLGAWWAGKRLVAEDAVRAKTEDELRAKLALRDVDWEYLRFVRGEDGKSGPWRPAAGTFDGWPKAANEIKVLDPCCGSGHFLVAGLYHLVPIRMAQEGLTAAQAVDAVLRDNLHGLEIDERCCQIAAFALAFAAWTYPEGGGYRSLPELHIACTGIGPQATKAQWLELAEKAAARGRMPAKRDLFGKQDSLLSNTVANALEALYDLFAQAPTLGSLIDPRRISKNLYQASYESLSPLLTQVFKAEADDETRERAIAAAGMVKAAGLLACKYSLVATNVPYLARGKQDVSLHAWADKYAPDSRPDLATMVISRSLDLCAESGTLAVVSPQNWLYLTTYKQFRERLLSQYTWNTVARLGPGAFDSISGHVVNIALSVISSEKPKSEHVTVGIEASAGKDADGKAAILAGKEPAEIYFVSQGQQRHNADSRVLFTENSAAHTLREFADFANGLQTCDYPKFIYCFWEFAEISTEFRLFQSTVDRTQTYGGLEQIILWGSDGRRITDDQPGAVIRGTSAWGKPGIAISAMSEVKASLYSGTQYDDNTVVILPKYEKMLPAVWACCSSPDYNVEVRKIDRALKVRRALIEVPFDAAHWQKVAINNYPEGLPEPESDDPTQWLFHGRPDEAREGTKLQVAVARLLGYRWPAELDDRMRLSKRARALVKKCNELAKFADNDGIVCIPAVRGEEPAAERLLRLLAACGIESEGDLDDWLRNSFYEEHCKMFLDRPFIWHIWDGRKRDGFHALVNYHKLCEGGGKGRRLLESLAYAYLGDWITRQKDGVKRGEGGAEDRLAAAVELQNRLKAILEGEPPFDIFVRWKPLAKQPIGGEPDINDGVRVNIRPFLASDLPGGRTGAGILRYKPNIKWTKDRGKEPTRPKADYPWFWNWDETTEDFMGTGKEPDGNRHNDCHYTNKVKQAARNAAKKANR